MRREVADYIAMRNMPVSFGAFPEPARILRVRGGLVRFFLLAACLSAILLPNLCLYMLTRSGDSEGLGWRSLLAALGFVSILLSLLKWVPRLLSAVIGICVLPVSAMTWYVVSFGGPVDINVLSLIAETGSSEAQDFLFSTPPWVWLGFLASLALAIGVVLLPWKVSLEWPARMLVMFGSGVILILALAMYGPDESMFGPAPDDIPSSEARSGLLSSYPLGVPLLLYDYRASRRVVAKAMERRQGHVFGARSVLSGGGRRQIYVFVIGETGRGSRWHVNGYGRPTTPGLSARSDVISFSRMSTPFVFTRLSVPAMITRSGTGDLSGFYEGSLVAAFKEAGFSTAWISMQAPLGFHESMVSSYAGEADEVQFLNPSDYAARGFPDMVGVDAVMNYVGRQPANANLFIVLHTLGSHFKYTDRYPLEDAYFLPDRPVNGHASLYEPGDALYLSNAYDNSIRYTDKMLNSLFDRLQGLGGESWVYYSADHGEAIFDGCDGSSGHGQFNAETQSVAAAFWASPTYVGRHVDRIELLRARATARLSTVMVFETLTGLGGVSMPGQRQGYDFSFDERLASPPARRYANCEIPQE